MNQMNHRLILSVSFHLRFSESMDFLFLFIALISFAAAYCYDCGDGLEWDPVGTTCRSCLEGTVYNKHTKKCKTISVKAKQCKTGFRFDLVEEKCVDIDECNENKFPCSNNEDCVNEQGGYKCKHNGICYGGYKFNTLTQKCQDIDECVMIPGLCQSEVCENIPGSWNCRDPCLKNKIHYWNRQCNLCEEGFWLNRTTNKCEDMDECVMPDKKWCKPYKERCVKKPGLSICEPHCSGGTKMINGTCYDIDECSTRTHNCTKEERCINVFGTHECIAHNCDDRQSFDPESNSCLCKKGFEFSLNVRRCADKDECAAVPPPCGPHGRCINSPGSYTCICNEGYHLVNGTCQDINECVSMPGICESLFCENLPGNFTCACATGFRTNEYDICEDIDECVETPDICSANNLLFGEKYRCFNLVGSFKCLNSHCPAEYREIGGTDTLQCELLNRNCSFHNNNDCFQTLPETIFFHIIQIPKIFEFPHKLTVIRFGIPRFDDYRVQIIMTKVIDSRKNDTIETQNLIMMTYDEERDRTSIYLSKPLPRSSEFVLDVYLKYNLETREKIHSLHKYHVFSNSGI